MSTREQHHYDGWRACEVALAMAHVQDASDGEETALDESGTRAVSRAPGHTWQSEPGTAVEWAPGPLYTLATETSGEAPATIIEPTLVRPREAAHASAALAAEGPGPDRSLTMPLTLLPQPITLPPRPSPPASAFESTDAMQPGASEPSDRSVEVAMIVAGLGLGLALLAAARMYFVP